MSRRNFLSLVVLLSFLSTLIVVHLHPVRADFAIENDDWNGLSGFAAETTRVLRSTEALADLSLPATLVLVGPGTSDSEDIARLHAFLDSGGTIVLLEDQGAGGGLVEAVGVDIVIAGALLRDPLHCVRDPALARAYPPSGTETGHQIVLNHASWLIPGEEARILLESSFFAYSDANSNGQHDDGEATGPLPVAAGAPVGRGRVIVAADSSLLINGMRDISDNVEWLKAQCDGDIYLYDASPATPLRADALTALRKLLGTPAGAAAAATAARAVAVLYAWYNRERHYE